MEIDVAIAVVLRGMMRKDTCAHEGHESEENDSQHCCVVNTEVAVLSNGDGNLDRSRMLWKSAGFVVTLAVRMSAENESQELSLRTLSPLNCLHTDYWVPFYTRGHVCS